MWPADTLSPASTIDPHLVPPMPTVPPLLVASPLPAPQLTAAAQPSNPRPRHAHATTAPQQTPRPRHTRAAPLPRRRRSSCAPATTFEAALTDLAAEGATGVLHGPAGAVHLAAGLVVHAESPRGASVGHLLTGAGRITVRDWEESAVLSGGHPADHLLSTGRIGRAELELARLAATLDGAHDALAQHDGELRFDSAVRPAFRLARPLSVLELRGAVGRRRALLDACWPAADLDSVPPVATGAAPVRRTAVPRHRRQALLAAADGTRTVPELARLLGRTTFGTLLDVRQLAAAGLLTAVPSDPPPVTGPLPAVRPAVLPAPPPAAGPRPAPPDVLLPPGPRSYDTSDPEVGLLLRLRAALEAL
ncbi:transcriptional regulator [Kitasatospora sp. NPDC092948]|uniref:transcriptional regulator n=1 Tax=Kitasatospora sp. NPDC092948 TaxID=3364088 RepID=UPI0038068E14